jgi:hypothetical protein
MPDTPRPADEPLTPMSDRETALTIGHMNPGVSVTQAELVIELLRRNGWLSPADLPVHERQVRERVAAEIYAEARKWAANAQASSTVPERERRFAVADALTKAATQAERGGA